MPRFTTARASLPTLLIPLALVACGCRSIAPPAPKYDVEPEPEPTPKVPPKPSAEADGTTSKDEEPAAEIPVVPSRKSLCEEPTVEMQTWDVEQGTDVDYTLCRADRPVDDIEVGYRWRHSQVEIDILKNPDPIDPNHDELSIFLTNVHEAPLEIRVACKAVSPDARNEVCKRYQSGQMVNFDVECVGRAEVGASGDSYELAVTISPAEGQATAFKFTAGPLTGDCGGD
jgi:hypothetical protein